MNVRMLNFGFFLEAMWFWVVQAAEKYPYFPGQEATLRGDVDFLLEVSLTSSPLSVEVAVDGSSKENTPLLSEGEHIV